MLKFYFRCDREAAERELNLALELNPGDMRALDYHSYYLLETGRTDEAISEKKRVLEHDPLRVNTNAELPLYLLQAGRTDEAIAQLLKTLELDPSYGPAHARVGLAYVAKQQYRQAVTELQKALSLDKRPDRLASLGEVYARWGKRQEALETIRQLQQMSKQSYVAPNMIALIYSRLGEKDAAIAWLEKAKPQKMIQRSPILGLKACDPMQGSRRWRHGLNQISLVRPSRYSEDPGHCSSRTSDDREGTSEIMVQLWSSNSF